MPRIATTRPRPRTGEYPYVEERVAPPELHAYERGAGDHSDHPAGDHRGVSPAGVGPLDEREHDAYQREDRERDPQQVEGRGASAFRLRQNLDPSRHDDERHRHVYEEHRLPTNLVHEHAAEHGTDHEPGPGRRCPHAERLRPLLRREHHGDQREGRRQHTGRGGSHQHTPADERDRGRRERAEYGCHGEAGHAGEKDALASEAVGEPAAEEQQPGKGDKESVEHPLEFPDTGI